MSLYAKRMAQDDNNDIVSHCDDSLGHSSITLGHNDGRKEQCEDSVWSSEGEIGHNDGRVGPQGYLH